jgi:hypothetical protein
MNNFLILVLLTVFVVAVVLGVAFYQESRDRKSGRSH